MTRQQDLDPIGKTGAQLIDAIWAAYRADQRDSHGQVSLLLEHDDPVVREEAISLLLIKWRDGRYRDAARAMLDRDSDFGVRAQAALGLAAVSTEATREEDLAILLNLLRDPGEEAETRSAAYDALLILGKRQDFPSSRSEFDPDRDIDWEWLSTLERE